MEATAANAPMDAATNMARSSAIYRHYLNNVNHLSPRIQLLGDPPSLLLANFFSGTDPMDRSTARVEQLCAVRHE